MQLRNTYESIVFSFYHPVQATQQPQTCRRPIVTGEVCLYKKEVKMKCSSCGRDIRENASYCSDCSQEVQGSGLNEQEMTEIWKELKDKRYGKIISYVFSTFFLFSGVVGVIKTSSSFVAWMVVASFIVSALLFISSARCGKRIKELERKLERRV